MAPLRAPAGFWERAWRECHATDAAPAYLEMDRELDLNLIDMFHARLVTPVGPSAGSAPDDKVARVEAHLGERIPDASAVRMAIVAVRAAHSGNSLCTTDMDAMAQFDAVHWELFIDSLARNQPVDVTVLSELIRMYEPSLWAEREASV